MNTARPLNAEREYCRLHRADHDARVANAVHDLDQRLERYQAAPHAVPMPRGKLQRFDGFTEDAQTVFRYKTKRLGKPLLFSVPSAYCTPEMEALFAECVDSSEAEEDTLLDR